MSSGDNIFFLCSKELAIFKSVEHCHCLEDLLQLKLQVTFDITVCSTNLWCSQWHWPVKAVTQEPSWEWNITSSRLYRSQTLQKCISLGFSNINNWFFSKQLLSFTSEYDPPVKVNRKPSLRTKIWCLPLGQVKHSHFPVFSYHAFQRRIYRPVFILNW